MELRAQYRAKSRNGKAQNEHPRLAIVGLCNATDSDLAHRASDGRCRGFRDSTRG